MKHDVEIAGQLVTVEYSYNVTSAAYPGRAADLNQPGEPPEAMEFEVTIDGLTLCGEDKPLEIPDWLREILTEDLQQSDAVYEAVREDYENGYGGDPDDAADMLRETREMSRDDYDEA
jgi:hypothetical protein